MKNTLFRRLTLRLDTYTYLFGLVPFPEAAASAFALDATTVITNQHCVDRIDCRGFRLKGLKATPNRITTFTKAIPPDLAIVKYEVPHGLPQVTVSTEGLCKNDAVWFIDSRHGLQQRTVTVLRPKSKLRNYCLGQFSGKVSPGTSGSPLFNAKGHVVGLIYGEIQQRKTSKPEGQFILMEDLLSFIHD